MMLKSMAVLSALSHTGTCGDWLDPPPLRSLLSLEGGTVFSLRCSSWGWHYVLSQCCDAKVGLQRLCLRSQPWRGP